MIDVVVPDEQEGTKAVVRAWLRQIGDRVEENDPLVELETDKVAMEVPAPAAGVLREILLHTDDDAVPGAVLGRIGPIGEAGETNSVRVERSRDNDRVGHAPGMASGLGGSPDPVISSEVENKSLGFARRDPSTSLGTNGERERETRLSPSVKRAILQHDIDPARIEGTGRGGRITRADVDRAVESATRVEGVLPAASPSTSLGTGGDIRSHFLPHDRMRRAIADNMQRSLSDAPHVTAVFEADFSAIIAHREAHKAAFAKKGVKLTYTAYLVAAAAEAMKAAPPINSRWHDDRLELYDDVNIGIGTALGSKGLVVPVLRKVQQLSLKGIAAGLDQLIERAREEKLTAADLRGGTFTISNHGVSGSLFAAPIIINQPQSAILGVGKLEKRVVVREVEGADSIQIRPMAYVSLTIDHRVVDGHQTNAWLSRFVELLERWPNDAN
jgi:2-oxoglutarate dehydrogenase E2 component (dihydrolipoamide succinyltransferase)